MSSGDRERAIQLVPTLAGISGKLEVYAALLERWQSRINLVGRSTLPYLWTRHFADSAQLAEIMPLSGCWVDLGSGAGFPGLVLALLQDRSVSEMHLIESDARKAAFLREVSRETGSGAIVHNDRSENVLGRIQPRVITSRAMADMEILFGQARPFVEKGGVGLFLKGRDIGSELTRASIPSNFLVTLSTSKVDPDGSIVMVRSV